MANNLPMRIRQNIRDYITSPTSPLSLKFKNVSITLGYPVTFDPEWPMIWGIFERHYPNPEIFVPSAAAVLVAWCDAFVSWLERTDNEESVDKLLEILKNMGRLGLALNASGRTSKEDIRARTRFDLSRSRFDLILPSSKPLTTSSLEAAFASDLLELFQETTMKFPSSAAAAADEPDWADVSIHSPTTELPSTIKLSIISNLEVVDSLPDIATIERPEELIKKPPYWLIVRQEGRNRVVIEASHGPSLSVIERYLKKWCRGEVNMVDCPPVVEIKLRESPFGLGLLYDTLLLETTRGREMSATLVLAFVENVLGYVPEVGRGPTGCVWEFKRTRAFK